MGMVSKFRCVFCFMSERRERGRKRHALEAADGCCFCSAWLVGGVLIGLYALISWLWSGVLMEIGDWRLEMDENN